MLEKLLSIQAVSYGLIPIGVMFISWAAQASYRMKLNAGAEVFAFALGLDLNMLLDPYRLPAKVNPQFRSEFTAIFVLALIISTVLLIYSAKVQSLIAKRGTRSYYPYVGVGVCWMFGIGIMGFHLFALFGG